MHTIKVVRLQSGCSLIKLVLVAHVELRDSAGPDPDTHDGRLGSIVLERHSLLAQVLVHLRNNLFLALVHNAAVGRPPNVVEEQLLALGAAAGEQGRAVDGAQRSDALRPRVQLPKARDLSAGVKALRPERRERVREGDGSDRGVVERAQGSGRISRCVLQQRCRHVGWARQGHRARFDGDVSIRGGVIQDVQIAGLGNLGQLPVTPDLVRDVRLDRLGQHLQALTERANGLASWLGRELGVPRRRRVGLILLDDLDGTTHN
mmetsp:Transcript_20852/g.52629  ORF Transcript_20852/g.52629 Transcript_20852/m.52629 type:complete len:262 (-) Transcript_20852:492-1277(-)